MHDIEQALNGLGLGGHEAAVYAALLAHSPAGASYLAKRCALSRSSVYTTLSALTAKGLVGTTHRDGVKQFAAQDVGAVQQMLEKERAEIDARIRVAEKMKALVPHRDEEELPHIVSFEGQEGLKRIYLGMMRAAPQGATRYLLRDEFVWQPEWAFVFAQEWSERIARWRKEKRMKTKLLINPSKLENGKRKFYASQAGLTYRFLPQQCAVERYGLYIIGDMVAILSFESGNLVGVQISNAHIAENFRKQFEMLWLGSKK